MYSWLLAPTTIVMASFDHGRVIDAHPFASFLDFILPPPSLTCIIIQNNLPAIASFASFLDFNRKGQQKRHI